MKFTVMAGIPRVIRERTWPTHHLIQRRPLRLQVPDFGKSVLADFEQLHDLERKAGASSQFGLHR